MALTDNLFNSRGQQYRREWERIFGQSGVVPEVVRGTALDRVAGGSDNDGVGRVTLAYLAHPYAKKDVVEELYQPQIESWGIKVLNPFQRVEQAGYEVAMSAAGLTDAMCKEIVDMDLMKIDQAGAVIALMIDDNMIGTVMEIFYAAYVRGYPVFTYTPRDRERKHPWIRNLTTVCPTLGDLEVALRG